MSKDYFKPVDVKEARLHAEGMSRKKKKAKDKQIERVEKDNRYYGCVQIALPVTDDYRDNYEKIFGHK